MRIPWYGSFWIFLKRYLLLSPIDYFERNSIDNYITKEWHWSVCLCKCVSFRLLVSKVPPYVFLTKSSWEKSFFFTTFQNYNKKCKLKSVSILKVIEQITLLSHFYLVISMPNPVLKTELSSQFWICLLKDSWTHCKTHLHHIIFLNVLLL